MSDNPRHGPEYRVWKEMRRRCNNENRPEYQRYGGRGIRVCERWDSFENFLEDIGKRPSGNHSIDRVDNNGDYRPSNCRWSTKKEQALNRRTNRLIEYRGRTQHLSLWAKEISMNRSTLTNRLDTYGMSIEQAFNKPLNKPLKTWRTTL